MTLNSGTRLGPYEIVAPLGAGGMGEVYRARDTRLDRYVALKVLPGGTASAQALERFEREAKAIAALNHPGICAVYDVGTSPVPFLVMELLEGETVHDRLARGPLDVTALVDIGLALADALASAHGKGIVHRDLKPANVVLTPRGPKILDFGLARIGEMADPSTRGATIAPTLTGRSPLTDIGVAVGTVAYMSPEQLRGEALDARTDLFSLGLVLYEMATGRRAFSGTTSAMTAAAILHDQPAPPRDLRSDLPVRLEEAILTLLEKDRDVRTQTASELRAELTRLKRELGGSRPSDAVARAMSAPEAHSVGLPPASAVAAPPSSSDAQIIAGLLGRHRRAVAAAAALIVLAIAGAAYVLAPRDARPAAPGTADVSIADLKVEPLTTSGTADVPAISPDGNYVVYVERGTGVDSLRVRQVASGSNVVIVPAEPGVALRGATVTPDGAFVNYVRERAPQPPELWQIPFLGGSPHRLLAGFGGRVAYSPDGREMAYVRPGGDGQTELVVVSSDGSRDRVLATRRLPERFWLVGPNISVMPAWSPDGATIAALGGRVGTGQIVFVDVKTGAQRTADAGPPLIGTGVAWLDDHVLIVSMLDRSSAPLQLWSLSYPDGKFSRLSNDTDQYVTVSVTADRNALVTARSDSSFVIWESDDAAVTWRQTVPATPAKGPVGFAIRWIGDDLAYVDTAAGGLALTRWQTSTRTTEVLAPAAGAPSVSRDGSIIMFWNYDTGGMWKMDTAGRNRVMVPGVGFPGAQVTPDGRELTFVYAAAAGGPAVRIHAADGTGTGRTLTADRVRIGAAPAWTAVSPDGRWIAFPSFDERKQPTTAVCDIDTCSARRALPPIGLQARWMPDGRSIAYVDPRLLSDLWAQPIDGSPPRPLTHFPADGQQIWSFDWSADGKRLAVARARISSDIVLFRGLRRASDR